MGIAPRIAGLACVLGALFCAPAGARAQTSVSAAASLSGDDQSFRSDQYRLELRRDAASNGQRLSLRFHTYSLDQEFDGILPFEGSEPAVELAAHLLHDLFWFGAALGLQGTADLDGLTGKLVLARAIPAGSSTFTPRLELAREPLAMNALPLSLGLVSHRIEPLLSWRAPGWTAEGGVRVHLWESDTLPGRVRNPALDTLAANRVIALHAYVLTAWEHWFNLGLAAKTAWSQRNTLLPTALQPRAYAWYPASAPPFLWETGVVLRATGRPVSALELSSQLLLPAVSQETRQWETLQRTYWGTGPLEAKLEVSWFVFSSTTVQLRAELFAKPWENWQLLGRGAYRQLSLQLLLEQRL